MLSGQYVGPVRSSPLSSLRLPHCPWLGLAASQGTPWVPQAKYLRSLPSHPWHRLPPSPCWLQGPLPSRSYLHLHLLHICLEGTALACVSLQQAFSDWVLLVTQVTLRVVITPALILADCCQSGPRGRERMREKQHKHQAALMTWLWPWPGPAGSESGHEGVGLHGLRPCVCKGDWEVWARGK